MFLPWKSNRGCREQSYLLRSFVDWGKQDMGFKAEGM